MVVAAAEESQPVLPPSSASASLPAGSALPILKLDYLSAALWDEAQFVQGVKMFNTALDEYRQFLRNEASFSPLIRAEEGALQAAQIFEGIRTAAPASVPLGDYVARCQMLVNEVRRLGHASAPAAAAPAPLAAPVAPPRHMAPPPRPGEAWQEPDYLQGAKLFNSALEQYKVFLADKSRTELLKPIEESAFQAAKKFESLKELAPTNVPVGDHITQCYKLISDCRRQTLELAPPGAETPNARDPVGPSHRPALPAYQPPPPQ
jgi:hypothetical protein